jgi:hypothetical protein
MKLNPFANKSQDEQVEDGFPDPSDEEYGLIPAPEEIALPAIEVSPAEPEPVREASSLDVLLHFGLGAVLLGINSVTKRLGEKQAQIQISSAGEEPLSHTDDDQERLRYALIGMILSTPRVVSRGTARAARMADASFSWVSSLISPVTGSRVLRPINNRVDQMVARGERIVSDWVDLGRRGEKSSQALLKQTTDEVVGDLVEMVASRPEITELVQQQGMGMVDELTDEMQGRAAAADTILERVVFLLLPGKKSDTTPTLVIPLRYEHEHVRAKKQTPRGRS